MVEDDAFLRMVAVEFIGEAGFPLLEASSADEAIALLESHPGIRVVFSDIEMPGSMDGLKLCHYIRDRWPPVLLIVASGKMFVAERQLPIGAKFFPKPYDHSMIVSTIKSLLRAEAV